MNKSIEQLFQTAARDEKRLIGMMSGTSLDGLDIALCRIRGTGENTGVELESFRTDPYPPGLKSMLQSVAFQHRINQQDLCLLHRVLAEFYADRVLEALALWQLKPVDIDGLASHGQTVFHAPRTFHGEDRWPDATLQIGDGDHLARKTGILTISDFRQKHTAAGGEGAPMVALVDRMLYREPGHNRILLNIGGIANLTYLPGGEKDLEMVTTDTGPGNTLINTVMQEYFDRPFDRDGAVARSGNVQPNLLQSLLDDPFFSHPLPKTTGPEYFSRRWMIERLGEDSYKEMDPHDLVATLTWLTAESIARAIRDIAGDGEGGKPEIYLSGGGMHNSTLIDALETLWNGYTIASFEAIGYEPDAKEAVSFAVLANETLSGEGFLIRPGGSAPRRVHFGKISLPV